LMLTQTIWTQELNIVWVKILLITVMVKQL
jgi:hypothetical protein